VIVDVDEQAGAALDVDAVGADIAMEIIAEAVSNAIRHGKAKAVHIEMRGSEDRLRLTVRNAGSTVAASSHGLGTAMIEDCSLKWSRGPVEGGYALDVVLPTQD
jgi:signal transduction histidine kinase